MRSTGTEQPDGFGPSTTVPARELQLVRRAERQRDPASDRVRWGTFANFGSPPRPAPRSPSSCIWRCGTGTVKHRRSELRLRRRPAGRRGQRPVRRNGCFADTCHRVPARPNPCHAGAPLLRRLARREYAVDTAFRRGDLLCGTPRATLPLCPTARQSDGYPLASMVIYGARGDDHGHAAPRPSRSAARCSPAGWRRPSDLLAYDASDNDRHPQRRGSRSAGKHAARRASVRLPPARAVLRRRRAATLGVPAGVPDGTHAARIVAEDAAGNATVVQRDRSGSTARRRPRCSSARAAARSCSRSPTRVRRGRRRRSRSGASSTSRTARSTRKVANGRLTRQARPRPRLAHRHARHGPRRGGQRRAGQPDAARGHEREGRPPHPPGPLRPREGAVRPPRNAARAAHALRGAAVRRPDDRRAPRRSAAAAPAHAPPAAR